MIVNESNCFISLSICFVDSSHVSTLRKRSGSGLLMLTGEFQQNKQANHARKIFVYDPPD